jgi:hypothetical protein
VRIFGYSKPLRTFSSLSTPPGFLRQMGPPIPKNLLRVPRFLAR